MMKDILDICIVLLGSVGLGVITWAIGKGLDIIEEKVIWQKQ